MYCTQCGKPLADSAKFCPGCGCPTAAVSPPQIKASPAPAKNSRPILWALGSFAVCICLCLTVLLIWKGIESLSDVPSRPSEGKSGKSSSLFSGLTDYELDGLLFRVPDDIEWEDEDIYDDEISLEAEDFLVFAEVYDARDLKNCDVEDEDDFVEFIAWAHKQNRGDYETPEVNKFRGGHCIVIEGEKQSSVLGVYMEDDQAWVIGVHIHDPEEFEDYFSLAESIACSGIVRDR